MQHATTRTAAAVRSYAQQVQQTVYQIDQVVLSLKYDWENRPESTRLENMKEAGLFPSDYLVVATIINADGEIATTSLAGTGRPNYAQQDFFKEHQAGCCPGLLITGPSLHLRVHRETLRFTRAIRTKDGAFDGVADVAVEPAYLTATFQPEEFASDGAFISVRQTGGALLATKVGRSLARKPYFIANPVFEGHSGVKVLSGDQFRDGAPRIVAWQQIEKYGLTALAGLPTSLVLAAEEPEARRRNLTAVGASAIILVAGLMAMLYAEGVRRAREKELETREGMRLATDAANEGFFSLAPVLSQDGELTDFRFEDCNARGAELLGLPRSELLAAKLSDVVSSRRFPVLMTGLRKGYRHGFLEAEQRVPQDSRLDADWVYYRMAVVGQRLVLTLRDISHSKAQERALSELAARDALTGLPNRYWLSHYLPEALSKAQADKAPLAILFLDLDNFKNVNDTLGHAAGDELLKMAASRIRQGIRLEDYVVRLGGDEFTVILANATDKGQVAIVAEHILRTLAEPFLLSASHLPQRINASIGIAISPVDGADAESLIKHADVAMYASKAAGKGRFTFYESRFSETLLLRLDKEAALKTAVEQDQFVVHYQPRVNAESGRLTSLEALVRWNHPSLGLLSPGHFIDIAEDTGLIERLGEIVIDKVCSQLAQWKAQGLYIVPVSVNVSPHQLRTGTVSSYLIASAEKYGIEARHIEVELTESAVIEDSLVVSDELLTLRRAGFRLLIDDFGTGYSSMSQLHRLDVDVLKVDRGLTQALVESEEGKKVFTAIVSMADALDMSIVAEGVETQEQLRELQKLDCHEVQGFLISEAVSATEIAHVLISGIARRASQH